MISGFHSSLMLMLSLFVGNCIA